MVPLPEDLSRLGDELTAAAGRTLDERRRRRRLLTRGSASALSGVLVFAVLAPAALGPGAQSRVASEMTGSFVVRPPERPPVLLARDTPDDDGGPPAPFFPSLTVRRDA